MNYFLHGNLGSADDWAGLLGKHVDLWASSELPFWEWAFDFCSDVRSRDYQGKNYLVGYSLGGRLALHALIAEPEIWAGAIIVSANPGLCCVEDRMARRISDENWAGRAREMEWSDFLEKWNMQGVLTGGQPSESQRELEAKREAVAKGFENWSLGRQEDLRERLKKLPLKMLWVTGGKDRKFSSYGREMAGILPDCSHIVAPDSGHRVIFDQRKWFSDLVKKFCV